MGKKKNESLSDCLKRLGIDKSRYYSELSKLQQLGYSAEQADCIILRQGSKNTVKKLLELHQSLQRLGFTHNKLCKIATHVGGSKNLQAILDHYEALNGIDFYIDAILKMIAHDGGSKNLKAIKDYYQDLQALGFAGYLCRDIKGSFCGFLRSHPLMAIRYFSHPKQDAVRLFVAINHPSLQNATEIQVQAAFALLVSTRIYGYEFRENQEALLEKSEALCGVYDSEAIVRFDNLADLWHKNFPVLDQSIIRDILASWFIEEINQWREQRYDASEDHRIPPEWIVHNGEFISVKNDTFLKDNFSEALAHWQPALPEEFNLDPLPEGSDPKIINSNAETATPDVSATLSLPISVHELLFGVGKDPPLTEKRKRDELNKPNKKRKLIENDQGIFEEKADSLSSSEEPWVNWSGQYSSSLSFFQETAMEEETLLSYVPILA